MPELSLLALAMVAVCCFLYGLSKTAMPVAGVVAGTVLAAVLGPAQSSGFIVPLLILGDCFALAYFRSHANWGLILRVLPGVLVGFILTALMFAFLPQPALARVIGVLILVALAMELLRANQQRKGTLANPHDDSALVTGMYGALAGLTTMGANAGGTAMTIYLIRMRVPMMAFMGTAAWFFFILNCAKVPFVIGLGLLTWESLLFDLWFVPLIVAGAFVGIFVFRRMTPLWFTRIALGLSGIAAVYLVIFG